LLNISTRLLTQTGDNVAIGGFIISGNDPKKVIIRGLGPSLADFGLSDVLPDPTLELRQDGSMIASNDDWQDAPNTADIPDGFEPTDPREAVIVTTLQPGAYTVIEAGKDNATGLGLVEVYDLDSAGDAILANISTRGFVETGNEVMIGGFILGGGTGGSTVVVRAIGPSLTPFGIGNALANPTLELHDENGALILNNDDWQDDPVQAAQITAAGFAPQNDLESAIIMLLSPRPYSAIVAGKDGGTGVALVEVYNLP